MFQYISKYTVYRRNEKEKHIYLQFHNSKLVNINFINFFKKFHETFLILIIIQ